MEVTTGAAVGTGVGVASGTEVGTGTAVDVASGTEVGTGIAVGTDVDVARGAEVGTGTAVGTDVDVGAGVADGTDVDDGDSVDVGAVATVGITVGSLVAVGTGVDVGVGAVAARPADASSFSGVASTVGWVVVTTMASSVSRNEMPRMATRVMAAAARPTGIIQEFRTRLVRAERDEPARICSAVTGATAISAASPIRFRLGMGKFVGSVMVRPQLGP